jgi:acyl dehydratase
MSELEPLRITPDRLTAVRYAGASGDFNPIHVDDDVARAVGLPGRILHGLWTMAQVARAVQQAGDGPQSLRRLSVRFRGPALPGEELTVTARLREERPDGVALVAARVEQGGKRIIRDAEAEVAR